MSGVCIYTVLVQHGQTYPVNCYSKVYALTFSQLLGQACVYHKCPVNANMYIMKHVLQGVC